MEKIEHPIPALSNNSLKNLRRLTQKKYRDKEGLYIIEGRRLCQQAIKASAPLKQFVFSQNFCQSPEISNFVHYAESNQISTFSTSEAEFASLVDTENPQGIAAVVELETKNLHSIINIPKGMLLGIDRIQDPGNLGTIIRTAEWFGVKGILCSKGTVDCFNPKVLRSAMGASFSVPIFQDLELSSIIETIKKDQFEIIGTSVKFGLAPGSFQPQAKTLFLVGSEAHGLDHSLLPFIDKTVFINGKGQSESLNVAIATGIILYELVR